MSFVCSMRNKMTTSASTLTLIAIVILIVISECQAKKSSSTCSLEFSLIGSKCYYFSKEETSWDDAFYQCLKKNSSLLILENSKEKRQIGNYLKRNSYSLGKNHRWIGGKFDWKNSKWVWAESGKPITYAERKPMTKKEKLLLQWTCLVLDPNKINMWSYTSCLNQKQFICQKKPKRPIFRRTIIDSRSCEKNVRKLSDVEKRKCLKLLRAPASLMKTDRNVDKEYICPSNMFVLKNRCYYFSQDMLNWNDAYWACRNNKTYLAVVQTKFHEKLLKEFLSSGLVEKHERWIGGLYDWKQKKWLWANSGKSMKYHNFPFENHIGIQFEWKSVTIDPDLGNMWNARLRTDLKHYICQKKAKTLAKLENINSVSDENSTEFNITNI